jgi:hypothetical protein
MSPSDFDALTPADAGDDPAAIAARCFRLAQQLAPGRVRDALLEMGRDYTARAREAAKIATFRYELARSQREAPPTAVTKLFDTVAQWLTPVPAASVRSRPVAAPLARASLPAPVSAPVSVPAPVSRPGSSRRVSRLFRAHALTRPII